MANTINATSTGSGGLITTGDDSGVLNIQTNETTAISIDASQAVSFTNSPTVTGGTANGVAYLNGSKVLTTGTALVFDGTNLGLGVTPTSIQTGYKAIQIGATVGGGIVSAGTDTYFTNNAYVTGGTWYSGSTGYASYYNQTAGVHTWSISTTAGAAGLGVTSSACVSVTSTLGSPALRLARGFLAGAAGGTKAGGKSSNRDSVPSS